MLPKKLLSTIVLCISFSVGFAQHWSELLNKPNPNYYEVKQAFDKEWAGKPYEKGKGYKQFKRWEQFMLTHMDRDGNYDPRKFEKSLKTWNQKKRSLQAQSAVPGAWQLLGPSYSPGPDGWNNDGIGRVKDIAFHPSDVNLFYIGAETGGLWKTTDGGTNYTYLSQSWPNNTIKSVWLNPSNPSELWVSINTYLMHTTNGGTTWTEVAYEDQLIFTSTFLAHFGKNILLTCGIIDGGMYSSDGVIWKNITGLENDTQIDEFIVHPTNHNIVYAISPTALYKSTNGGTAFSKVTTSGLVFGNTDNLLAVSAAQPNNLWILTILDNRLGAVYKSVNQGSSFTSIATKTTSVKSESSTDVQSLDLWFGGQGWTHAAIGVSNVNADRIFIGGVSIFQTEDGGSNWYFADEGFASESPHVDHSAIRFQPISNVPFSCNDGGLNRGLTTKNSSGEFIWKSFNENISSTQMYNLSVTNDGSRIITGQQDNGSFLFDAKKNTWTFLSIGDGMANGFDPANNDEMYIATQNGRIERSTTGDQNFDPILWGHNLGEQAGFYTKFEAHPMRSGMLLHLRSNLWRSTDHGNTWIDITGNKVPDFNTAGDFTFCYNNPDIIAVYDRNVGIYITKNGGETWSNIPLPVNQYGYTPQVQKVAIHSTDPNIIWFSDFSSVYETKNSGQTWKEFDTWPQLSINKIVHVDGTADELLIATTLGVFSKANGSSELVEFAQGLPKVDVKDLDIAYCTGEVYIATYGRGVWKNSINLTATACCKKSPQFLSDIDYLYCNSSQTVKVTGGNSYLWLRNGTTLSETGATLNITAPGKYEVYSKSGSCQSAGKSFEIKDVRSNGSIPLCKPFTVANLDEDIIVVKEHGQAPFKSYAYANCAKMDGRVLSFRINDASSPANGAMDTLSFALPELDLTYAKEISLKFDVSTPKNISQNAGNGIGVLVSQDCGKTFKVVFAAGESTIGVNNSSYDFVPQSCNDWKSFSVDLSEFQGKEILVKFIIHSVDDPYLTSFWGGNLYMDNICIDGKVDNTVSIVPITGSSIEIRTFPNPVINVLTVESPFGIKDLSLYDIKGNKMNVRIRENQIETKGISPGQYIVQVLTEKGISHVKIEKHF